MWMLCVWVAVPITRCVCARANQRKLFTFSLGVTIDMVRSVLTMLNREKLWLRNVSKVPRSETCESSMLWREEIVNVRLQFHLAPPLTRSRSIRVALFVPWQPSPDSPRVWFPVSKPLRSVRRVRRERCSNLRSVPLDRSRVWTCVSSPQRILKSVTPLTTSP